MTYKEAVKRGCVFLNSLGNYIFWDKNYRLVVLNKPNLHDVVREALTQTAPTLTLSYHIPQELL